MVVSEVVRYSAMCGCPVHATNQCVQTAQLEEGEKGKVITMNFRVESKLRHISGIPIKTHWLALWSHASARFTW